MAQKHNKHTKTQHRADILIIGGGIAGLSLAALLGRAGVNVHLVEPYPPKDLNKTPITGRTVALMQSSLNVLRAAGISKFCDTHGTKIEIMRLIDNSVSSQDTVKSEFDALEIGLDYFGMNIPNSQLRACLYENIKSMDNISIHEKCSLSDYKIENDGYVHAMLDNETNIITPLIIGADGRKSLVRSISDISAKKKNYGQSAITCLINHSHAHNNTSTEFHRPGGPFALVPLSGNQSSIVWVEKEAKADKIMALSKDAFEQELQERSDNILGGITLETSPECWPLCSMRAKKIIAQRTALIAEAAHVMSPITAQGLNLSLRDVAALAETVIDAMRTGIDHGNSAILNSYAARRSADISTRSLGVHVLNLLVSNDIGTIKDMRRIGLQAVDRFYPLKIFAMNHGLAPSLDQGRLVRGESL